MRYIKIFISTFMLVTLMGCKTLDCKPHTGTVLEGTNTAVVELYIDKNGYPQANVDTVKVYPGQKIIFVGPDKFEIFFKDQRSPVASLEIRSTDGTITLEIPKDIFERDQRESKSTDVKREILYRYGIRANGKVTDPNIVIGRS